MKLSRLLLLTALTVTFLAAADPANMSGAWSLDVKNSKWKQKPAPKSVELRIEHAEPKLKYTGNVVDSNETATSFSYEGALDGQEHVLREGGVDKKVVMKRLSPTTISSVTTGSDGSEEETVLMVTRDGKSLVRKIRVKGPKGESSWTELYNKI